MYRTQGVLALLALYVGLAHSFSWDIVMGRGNRLKFYNNDGKLTHTENNISNVKNINSVIYDPVHNRVLIYDRMGPFIIYSFDIATKKIQSFIWRNEIPILGWLTYDPVTETLFGIGELSGVHRKIYSFSLKPGSNDTVHDYIILINLDEWPLGIAVDSCGGYIYWTTKNNIERARFDGSERQVVINSTNNSLGGLVIDQLTQKLYWIEQRHEIDLDYYQEDKYEYNKYLASADLNGKNRRISKNALQTFGETYMKAEILTVSKHFIYWTTASVWPFDYENVLFSYYTLPKNPLRDNDFEFIQTRVDCYRCTIAANYRIQDQTQGIQNCDALKSLLPVNSVPSDHDSLMIDPTVSTNVSLLCVHGKKVSGESRCECIQGYIGERCDVFVCHNYCLQGDCSISAEGQPKCRCNTGYSGERCEVNACHEYCLNNGVCSLNEESDPVCQCTGGYEGERCNISVCQNYCFQGDCSASAEGQLMCRCKAGYSGERCEVNACHEYCLNNGVCSLNEESEPVCQSTGDYEGERCDVPVSLVKCLQTVSLLKDILNTDVTPLTLGKGVNSTCARNAV